MKSIRSIATLATLALGVTACSVNDGYYAPRPQATYYPATSTTTCLAGPRPSIGPLSKGLKSESRVAGFRDSGDFK